MGTGRPGGLLRTREGRVRLGWRLLWYCTLALTVIVCVSLVLPPVLLSSAVAMLAGGLLAGWALLAMDGRGPGALGFHLGRAPAPESFRGLALGVVVGLAVVAAMAALGGVRWIAEDGSAWSWLVGAAGAFAFLALPAAAEEALLRGYPLQALAEAWGPAWALAITSVAFGALHLWNPGITALGVANVTAAGVFLGVVYLKTASLWWATGAHLGWNWAHGYLADVPVSGLELMDAPYYDGVARGPAWLGGGAFGPEGSAVATALLLVASLWCWRARGLRPAAEALRTRPLALSDEGSAGDGSGLESREHGVSR